MQVHRRFRRAKKFCRSPTARPRRPHRRTLEFDVLGRRGILHKPHVRRALFREICVEIARRVADPDPVGDFRAREHDKFPAADFHRRVHLGVFREKSLALRRGIVASFSRRIFGGRRDFGLFREPEPSRSMFATFAMISSVNTTRPRRTSTTNRKSRDSPPFCL